MVYKKISLRYKFIKKALYSKSKTLNNLIYRCIKI